VSKRDTNSNVDCDRDRNCRWHGNAVADLFGVE
jgi:hypothetical protein